MPPEIAISPDEAIQFPVEISKVRLSAVNGTVARNLTINVLLEYPNGHLRSLNAGTDMLPNPSCNEWARMGTPNITTQILRQSTR